MPDTMSCALIACDNGFGHVRRCAMIAGGLAGQGMAVTLFAPEHAAARFPIASQVELRPFETMTTIAALCAGEAACRNWFRRLPPLDGFSLVVSDNLPEVLHLRPDAVLSGSFLWHQALRGIHPAIAADAERLLAEYEPIMIASQLFGMPELARHTNLATVGLCIDRPRPSASGADLLIACGGTTAMEAAFRELVLAVAGGPKPPFPVVWVEPRLLPDGAPIWMRPADFQPDLYRRLAAAICRPGIGTLTDCLWGGARVFAVGEPGNKEMALNAHRLVEANVGHGTADPLAAYADACRFVEDGGRRAEHVQANDRLDFDGVRATVKILFDLASSKTCAA